MKKNYLTYEKCKEEALKYNSRSEFKYNSSSAYNKALKNKWIDDICSHMKLKYKPNNYWTFENCKQEALKYNSRSDFAKSKGWGYNKALENGWLDEICSHMNTIGNYKKRCIYVYEFDNNYAYVGLTFNLEKRHIKRLKDKNDAVYIHLKNNKNYILKQLTDYVNVNDAKKLEKYWLLEYINNKWIILNRVKTGSIGGNIIKWSYEECKNEALKYKTHLEFRKNNNNCLAAIYKNNWNKELLKHLEYSKKINGFWIFNECLDKAKMCNSRTEFYNRFHSAYAASKVNNWFDEICLIANLNIKKSPLYYQIDDILFNKICDDRIKNKKSLEKLSKEYNVGIEKLRNKFKEKNIPIIRIDRI